MLELQCRPVCLSSFGGQLLWNGIYSVMRGFWHTVTVAVRLNIISELGNLVNVGSCDVYVVDHMEPNSYLPKLPLVTDTNNSCSTAWSGFSRISSSIWTMLQMESRLRTRHSSQEDREVYVELAEH